MYTIKPNWLAILGVLLLLPGCGDKQGESPAAPAFTRLDPPSATAPAAPQDAARAVILPERPLVNTPLVVAFQGQGASTGISWLRNGEPIANAGGEGLVVGNFAKGDTVTAVVRVGKNEYRASVVIGNSPPRVKQVAFRDGAIYAGRPVELLAETEDPDGDPVTLTYRWTLNGEENVIGEAAILPADNVRRGALIGFTVTPSDGETEGDPFQGSAFEVPNAPPGITSQPPRELNSTIFRYSVKAVDPDGDPIRYSLESPVDGMTIDAATGVMVWPLVGVAAGEYKIRIVVEDAAGATAYQEFSLTLNPPQ